MPASVDDAVVSIEDPTVAVDETMTTTFSTILANDVCAIIVENLHCFADLAALWKCSAAGCAAPAALHEAVLVAAARALTQQAPMWTAANTFEAEALWPITVAACDWRPRAFFAALRAPAFCRVTGSGRCAHGLCQKQETPKAGVLDLLHILASPTAAPFAPQRDPTVVWTAWEGIAWLCGALGRNQEALHAWARAAAAGSARAQLDVGIATYKGAGSASTLYNDPNAPPQAPPAATTAPAPAPAPSAASLLRAASRNKSLPALGLEGHTIKAKALMTLGMMHLDGDGAPQDDATAFECFEGVGRARRAVPQRFLGRRRGDAADAGPRECCPLPTIYGGDSGQALLPGEAAYALKLVAAMQTVQEDAAEVMESMDRFTFYANGRP